MRAAIETANGLTGRDSAIILRWILAYRGVEGNKQAAKMAKKVAEGKEGRTEQSYLMEANLTHLTRKMTEARSNATMDWIRNHTGQRCRYHLPRGGKVRKALARTRKELVG